MTLAIDAFSSATLKHLRESWWNDDFTEFLRETLRPRPGNRILGVGCGEGVAEVSIGRLHISQLRLFGVDLDVSKVAQARNATASHNQRTEFAAADACQLPFTAGAFDSLYGVTVLQHIGDVDQAVAEFARVTTHNGRVLAVEPDNSGRYVYSSLPSGGLAFARARKYFEALAAARHERTDNAIGPKLPGLFIRHGIEPIAVRLFPVSHTLLGAPNESLWESRRHAVEAAMAQGGDAVQQAGREYLAALKAYQEEAASAGTGFIEIQNTMLFATVGQKQ